MSIVDKKVELPFGNEIKLKKVKKDTKYYQSLEYREIEKNESEMRSNSDENSEPVLSLPIGMVK